MITMSKISICTAHNSANDEKTDMIKSNHGLLTLVLSRGMKDLLNECEIGKLCNAVVQRMININIKYSAHKVYLFTFIQKLGR